MIRKVKIIIIKVFVDVLFDIFVVDNMWIIFWLDEIFIIKNVKFMDLDGFILIWFKFFYIMMGVWILFCVICFIYSYMKWLRNYLIVWFDKIILIYYMMYGKLYICGNILIKLKYLWFNIFFDLMYVDYLIILYNDNIW